MKKMPSDGHCLFSAITHQVHGTIVGSQDHYSRIAVLRNNIVDHIEDNFNEYWESLRDTVSTLRHLENGCIEERVNTLLRRLRETNEWGGQESIAAAASILNRRIDVYYEKGPIIYFNRTAAAGGIIRLAYRLPRNSSRNAQRLKTFKHTNSPNNQHSRKHESERITNKQHIRDTRTNQYNYIRRCKLI